MQDVPIRTPFPDHILIYMRQKKKLLILILTIYNYYDVGSEKVYLNLKLGILKAGQINIS